MHRLDHIFLSNIRLERTIGKPSAPNPLQDKGGPKATTILARLQRVEHKVSKRMNF